MIDPLTALAFSVYENKGVYCLLLGSGISRPAQIPTGWEVTLDLVQRVAALQGVADEPDWAAWHKSKFGKEPNYSELLDQLASTPDERRSVLHSYIEPNAEDVEAGRKIPTRAHQAIARLVAAGHVRVIITTNFDRLTENALRENGVEPTVISSDDSLKGAVPLIHSRCYVVKIHGDYLDTRIRNTDAELGEYTPELNTLLDRIIDEHGLIVCGWSGDWDPALRSAITQAPNRRYPMFWAARGKLSAVAQMVVDHRAGKIITIEGADTFFERLEMLVSVQTDAQRPNPRSVDLLVASSKKFLTRSEFRIQLDELIGAELRRIDNFIVSGGFQPPAGTWRDEFFVSAVSRYEAQTEILARIFGVLGRYGKGDEFRDAADVITRLGYREPGSGFSVLINLRTYPAVLLFYAYGIALLKAQRFADLFRLFSTPVNIGRDYAPTVVSHLLLTGWEGAEHDPWNLMHGKQQRRTPLSDYLHGVFEKWTSDYLFTTGEFTTLFTHFELLGTLAYIGLANDKPTLQAALQARQYVRAPLGRAAWDGRSARSILDSWKGEVQPTLLEAGFARGDQDYLTLATESIVRLASNMRW
ncbi:SIR2 family protein [Bradyrhizobium septentrionale]|uniref:SIR2 family protein n=1 Tax=Bradyrhizobium septentrionale TaxID=1404411 RepID=A0ABZ2PC86_9BRAD